MRHHKLNVAGAFAKAALAVALTAALGGQLAGCQRDEGHAAPAGTGAPAAAAASASQASGVVTAQPVKGGLVHPNTAKTGDKPFWRSLNPAQQKALQPLQGEWDQMDGVRKQKWLQLAGRYDAMSPEERQRVQERMREWAGLTPAQRELARETYNRTRRIAPADKTASWESYQQLTPDQKQQLAASAAGRKAPAVVPSQASGKVVAPLGAGATSCPAGTVRNTVSATPPCVAAPPSVAPATPQAAPQTVPATPQPATPANPASPPPPDKQEPANWGITPNNA